MIMGAMFYESENRYDEEQTKRKGQGDMMRSMILSGLDMDEIVDATGFEPERVREENARLKEAWVMVLKGCHEERIVKETGITPREVAELRVMKRDRRNLFARAFDDGMTPDMVQSMFNLCDVEIKLYYNDWFNRWFDDL